MCYRVLQSITEYYTEWQIVTECWRVLQGLQSICSASTWTNFWTCFLFFFSPTSPPYSLSWSQSRFHWQPSIYMWWGGGSYKKPSLSSNCKISTYVQSISFLLSPFETRDSQKVFTDLQQKFSCQYIARDRGAELGSLSWGAKMALKIFVKRVFTIFATKRRFCAKLQFCLFNSIKYAIYTM